MVLIDVVILLAFSFMVVGLFLPTLGALFWRRVSGTAAFWSIVSGGTLTVWLAVVDHRLRLDPVFYRMGASGIVLVLLTLARPNRGNSQDGGEVIL